MPRTRGVCKAGLPWERERPEGTACAGLPAAFPDASAQPGPGDTGLGSRRSLRRCAAALAAEARQPEGVPGTLRVRQGRPGHQPSPAEKPLDRAPGLLCGALWPVRTRGRGLPPTLETEPRLGPGTAQATPYRTGTLGRGWDPGGRAGSQRSLVQILQDLGLPQRGQLAFYRPLAAPPSSPRGAHWVLRRSSENPGQATECDLQGDSSVPAL